ncbi:hypothetical protein B0H66DRAFT_606493 [Apodospora peruviana]|uniref:Cytochrome P450 n=1 Tax=Apodospora peruviana TaxID=516989 RepID=A0AAE0HZA2_9PEZI|nr:hypothetical protein B0H66DRAFT_606493 [Apodospora peruviana]
MTANDFCPLAYQTSIPLQNGGGGGGPAHNPFPAQTKLTVSAVNTRLLYLLAILSESLRMYPPVTGSLVRVIAGNCATVAGRYIPGGTMIECTPWVMNHYKRRDTLEAMQDFSVGPRNCIGRK